MLIKVCNQKPGDPLYEENINMKGDPNCFWPNELYGTVRLWWLFALRNPDILVDPIEDFKAGVTIFLPSGESVQRMMG